MIKRLFMWLLGIAPEEPPCWACGGSGYIRRYDAKSGEMLWYRCKECRT